MTNEHPFLTLGKLFTLLATPASTLRSLVARGDDHRSVSIGRDLRFDRRDVHAWLDGTKR